MVACGREHLNRKEACFSAHLVWEQRKRLSCGLNPSHVGKRRGFQAADGTDAISRSVVCGVVTLSSGIRY